MKEIELTKKDFASISKGAHEYFIEKSPRKIGAEGFAAYCYLEAIKNHCKHKNWVIKDGKIYEEND